MVRMRTSLLFQKGAKFKIDYLKNGCPFCTWMVRGDKVLASCEAQWIWGSVSGRFSIWWLDWEEHHCYIHKEHYMHKNTSPRRVAHSSFQQGRSVVTKCSHYAQPKACDGASEEEEGGGLCEPASTTPTHYVSHQSGAPTHYVTSQRWTPNPLELSVSGRVPCRTGHCQYNSSNCQTYEEYIVICDQKYL